MSVSLSVHEPMRRILKGGRIELDWSGGSVAELIEELGRRYGPAVKRELLDSEGNLDYTYRVFINDSQAEDMKTPVRDGDEVIILMPVSGGH